MVKGEMDLVPHYLKDRGPFIHRLGVCSPWFRYFTTWVKLHGYWGPRLETSIRQTRIRMPGCLLGSHASTWQVPRTVLGAVIASLGLSWLLSLPMWGADVDGLACFLHRPTVYGCQTRGQSFPTGATPSRHAVVGSVAFLGGAKPP
jgi:hypothetical protein